MSHKLFIPKILPFDGLFGVFSDSLPDGWGRLLVDRLFLKNHINPAELESLDRLAVVGSSGMGALEYVPEYNLKGNKMTGNLDYIAGECSRLLAIEYTESLDELFSLGASSGGARPKILTEFEGAPWIIKFPAPEDKRNRQTGIRLCGLCKAVRYRDGRNQTVCIKKMRGIFWYKAI